MILALVASSFAATPAKAPAPPPPPPEVPTGFVTRPTFVLADGKAFDAGTAFVVQQGDKQLLVTALSLLGPAGGQPAQLTADQVPTTIKEVRLHDAWTNGELAPGGPAVLVPGSHPMDKTEGAGDLVLVNLPNGIASARQIPRTGRPLAAANPKVGETVWVAAAVVDGPEKDAHLHQAKVVEASTKWLFFEYAEPGLNLVATSGAPVLNAKGEVVGINLGGGADAGKLYGSANPVDSVRPMVTKALE